MSNGRINVETATVYRGGGRRWFSLKAAIRAEAKAIHRARYRADCMCSEAEPGPYGAPGETCQFHEADYFARFTRRVARAIAKANTPAALSKASA